MHYVYNSYFLYSYITYILHHREWALICVRNICEGNKINQEYIQVLQPQKVVHDEFLESLGVDIKIDGQTGIISATSRPIEE